MTPNPAMPANRWPGAMTTSQHVYEVRPRKDHRGVGLISDALPFGRLWYGEPNAISNAVGYAKFFSRSHDAVIRVYDESGQRTRNVTSKQASSKIGKAVRRTIVSRLDISPHLIHFTSGENYEDAFKRLQKIVHERKLIAGTRCIKGSYPCVCFSEAPLAALPGGLMNEEYYSRYSPFGITVSKQWLFAQGGRPVIYEGDQEYSDLSEAHRWRHVLYELRENFYPTDFTWEREWRIKCDHLEFDETSAKIVVPDSAWAERLATEHRTEQDFLVTDYSLIFDDLIAEQYRKKFRWTVLTLQAGAEREVN